MWHVCVFSTDCDVLLIAVEQLLRERRRVLVFRTRCTWLSRRRHISTRRLLLHRSQPHVQAAPAAAMVRTHQARLTCCEHWAYRLTSHCSVLLCRPCVLGAWPGAELQGTGHRRCTMTSAWARTCLQLDRGRHWTRCVLRVHQIRTPLNVLPSSTAMLPVSTPSCLPHLPTVAHLYPLYKSKSKVKYRTFVQHFIIINYSLPSVLWCCWLGGRKGIWPVKN